MPLANRKKLSQREKLLIDNLKFARKDKDLSQEELSAKLGKNSNYMGMLESYRRGISFKTLFKAAEILNIKVKELFHNI
jgi:transcriptional regulator with XRE-family HTH domain